jgi:hypothetical protein
MAAHKKLFVATPNNLFQRTVRDKLPKVKRGLLAAEPGR